MCLDCRCQLGLHVRLETGEPNEHNSRVKRTLAKGETFEVLVRAQKERICIPTISEDPLIIDSRIEPGNKHNVVAVGAEPIDNLLLRQGLQ